MGWVEIVSRSSSVVPTLDEDQKRKFQGHCCQCVDLLTVRQRKCTVDDIVGRDVVIPVNPNRFDTQTQCNWCPPFGQQSTQPNYYCNYQVIGSLSSRLGRQVDFLASLP